MLVIALVDAGGPRVTLAYVHAAHTAGFYVRLHPSRSKNTPVIFLMSARILSKSIDPACRAMWSQRNPRPDGHRIRSSHMPGICRLR
jgi:hypothetical protein